jgi:hypothetical protein
MIEAESSYPLLNVFWTMVVFFAWMIWIWLLITIFADLFRRSDVSGWGKAGWTVLVIVLPFLGVLIYLIAQGRQMGERRVAEAKASQASFDSYVKSVATSTNGHDGATEIKQAKDLLDSGAISPAEFETLKRKALAS